MKLGLLVALAVAVLVPSLSEGRTTSKCELKEKLSAVVTLPKSLQKFEDQILAIVICEVNRLSHLNTSLVREEGERQIMTTARPATRVTTQRVHKMTKQTKTTKPTTTKPKTTKTKTTKPTTTKPTTTKTTTAEPSQITTLPPSSEQGGTNPTPVPKQASSGIRRKREAGTTSNESNLAEIIDNLDELINDEETNFDEEELTQDDNKMTGDEDEESDGEDGEQGDMDEQEAVTQEDNSMMEGEDEETNGEDEESNGGDGEQGDMDEQEAVTQDENSMIEGEDEETNGEDEESNGEDEESNGEDEESNGEDEESNGEDGEQGDMDEQETEADVEQMPWSLGYYGLFQLTDSHFCASGYRWSRNKCSTACTAFTDDDITDDIDCLVKTGYFWFLVRNASDRCHDTSNFFSECK
ncbi:high mobility group nucleosome-binding domain-containing protein 5-like isoform X1 [Trachinotus anak]|uniref:high mobility group nucleosome-binding domain-containing protein 5-like isoform X1 n=2 Tax=Trachinotus anak TaxID=443729 RepID=UPI0039F18423